MVGAEWRTESDAKKMTAEGPEPRGRQASTFICLPVGEGRGIIAADRAHVFAAQIETIDQNCLNGASIKKGAVLKFA
jgi:hypothetical protein